MKRKINLLYLMVSFDIGGAERVIARTVNRLDKNKYNIILAALKKGSGRLIRELQTPGVKIVDLGMQSKGDIRGPYRLYSLLKRQRVDLIYAYLFSPSLLGRLIGNVARVPIILSSLRAIADSESPFRLKLEALTCRYSYKITAASDAIRKSYEAIGIPKEKLLTIHNGVELDNFNSSYPGDKPRNGYIVGCVANARIIKGHKYLIEAIALLDKPYIHCRLIGDGREVKNLRDLARTNRLEDRVEFLGYRSDIPEQLGMLDIYVQPSLREGLPNSVLEAMASGLPVIATAVGGTPEAVIDGQTGFLVPPADPDAIAEKIRYILKNPDHARQIGLNARKYVEEHFSVESMVRKTDELFENVIAEKLGLCYHKDTQRWCRYAKSKITKMVLPEKEKTGI